MLLIVVDQQGHGPVDPGDSVVSSYHRMLYPEIAAVIHEPADEIQNVLPDETQFNRGLRSAGYQAATDHQGNASKG